MRALAMAVLGFLVMASVSVDAASRRSAAPPVDRAAEEPAFDGDVVPVYLEGWVRVYAGAPEGVPTYKVIHISDGPRTAEATEAELQRILDAGGWRVGTSFFPLHMIERFELRPYPAKP